LHGTQLRTLRLLNTLKGLAHKYDTDNTATTIRPLNQTAPYMSITKEKVFCVQVSAHKYPILPLAAFDQTISFPEMDADERHKLLIDLSQQIANYGYASAFIKNDTGNGFEVVYMLASDRPLRMYFHPNFVKSDEIADRHFSNVYKTTGAMSVTSHGPAGNSENFKLFFGR
jgi:hypothetical protein